MLIYCYFNKEIYINWCFVDLMKIHPTKALCIICIIIIIYYIYFILLLLFIDSMWCLYT